MANIYDIDTDEVIEFNDFTLYLDKLGEQPLDSNIEESALMLRKLCNQRTFMTDLICKSLNHEDSKIYTPQVFLIHTSEHYYMRACFWEPLSNRVGESIFGYHDPHDHNFQLLTAGYHGSGYATDVYNYNYDSTCGLVGEEVKANHQSKFNLKQNRVVHFLESYDVHTQLPPEEMSISINIIQQRANPNNQYGFNLDGYKSSGELIISEQLVKSIPQRVADMYNDEQVSTMLSTKLQNEPNPRNRISLYSALETINGVNAWTNALKDTDEIVVKAAQFKLNHDN